MPSLKVWRVPPGPDGPELLRPAFLASLILATRARVSEPCSDSMACIFGKVAASESWVESPAKTPVTMESTRISAA